MCADGGLFAACWFQLDDNRAEDLTKEVSKWRAWHAMAAFLDLRRLLLHASQGMRQGIITSGAFILFLSAGILSRPFCASFTFCYIFYLLTPLSFTFCYLLC